jgi:3-ketoacyl-CoA synthase
MASGKVGKGRAYLPAPDAYEGLTEAEAAAKRAYFAIHPPPIPFDQEDPNRDKSSSPFIKPETKEKEEQKEGKKESQKQRGAEGDSAKQGGSGASADAPPARQPKSIRSYWYPDRAADMGAVQSGFRVAYSRIMSMGLLFFVFLLAASVGYAWMRREELLVLYFEAMQALSALHSSGLLSEHEHVWITLGILLGGSFLSILGLAMWWARRASPVYLIDFSLYQGQDKNKAPAWLFMHRSELSEFFDKESLEFQEKLLARTGLGEETYFPDAMLDLPIEINMEKSREEAMQVFTGCIDDLFAKTGTQPKDIDFIIVNCSLFNPTPSLSAMVMNKYKMRTDCRNYNLAGMGCSAGVISIDLAKDLLQVHPNSTILVLSTENITQNWYKGRDPSKLISNTLFRMGGAAMLLSNKRSDGWRAMYKLKHLVRVHKAQDDVAYKCVFQEEDDNGLKGVTLRKELLKVAAGALKENITVLGPLVLPISEQVKFFVNLTLRRLNMLPKGKAYVPDFKKAFQHFCIHAGGRAIIDGLEENFKLEPHHTEPSRATLYRYGNTSSSSIWYELQFIERSGRAKRGDRVLQIALGSGFKCNSAVWERL